MPPLTLTLFKGQLVGKMTPLLTSHGPSPTSPLSVRNSTGSLWQLRVREIQAREREKV